MSEDTETVYLKARDQTKSYAAPDGNEDFFILGWVCSGCAEHAISGECAYDLRKKGYQVGVPYMLYRCPECVAYEKAHGKIKYTTQKTLGWL